MSKLPEMCAQSIKKRNGTILLNAKVKSITRDAKLNLVRVGYTQQTSKDLAYELFDKIILAIPPPCIRAIPERPHFGTDPEHALRASHFWPVSKMSLRFHSRFWERTDLDLPPSHGGRSKTDLPSRWFVYPNHGIGEEGKGVLSVYNWKNDTQQWCLMPKVEKVQQALQDLQALYPEVDIAREYAGGDCPDSQEFLSEAVCVDWFYGMTLYYPGQFITYFPSMVKPQGQGSIYFAGSHLSSTLVWVVSALESAKRAVQQLLLNTQRACKVDYL
jgi:monoamine oxidase